MHVAKTQKFLGAAVGCGIRDGVRHAFEHHELAVRDDELQSPVFLDGVQRIGAGGPIDLRATSPRNHERHQSCALLLVLPVVDLDGQTVIAAHPRSFARREQIERPEHIATLLEHKHQASAHRGTDQLVQAVPTCRELLSKAVERGEPLGRTVRALTELLARYGVAALTAAVADALDRGVPHPNAVRLALERRRQAQAEPPPLAAGRH